MLAVSRSGFYDWQGRETSKQRLRREEISHAAQHFYTESKGVYGYRKVHEDILESGLACCAETVRRVLSELGLQSKVQRRHRYPFSKAAFKAVAENKLSREFQASAPNEKWAADITYVPTREGWLYLAVIEDLFSRKIVGWAMSGKADGSLACAALKMALAMRKPGKGLMHHSDQGVQYRSESYSRQLEKGQLECSMSRPGNCLDNAVVESFFSKLKREWVNRKNYKTREEARQDIFIYLEIFYNRKRRHASLGYKSPEHFEELYNLQRKTAA